MMSGDFLNSGKISDSCALLSARIDDREEYYVVRFSIEPTMLTLKGSRIQHTKHGTDFDFV